MRLAISLILAAACAGPGAPKPAPRADPADPADPDPDGDAWSAAEGDCAPEDPAIHPGQPEVCNGEDDDCDGLADNPPVSGDTLWYPDVDRDGFGDAAAAGLCAPEPGWVDNNLDCGDRDDEVKPGAVEVCNDGVDNDCSGVAEGCGWPAVVELDGRLQITPSVAGGEGFGSDLAVADVDGDGLRELVIAEVGAAAGGGSPPGAFHVFNLPLSTPASTSAAATWRSRDSALGYLGQQLVSVDLDLDGFQDLVVSSIAGTAPGHGEGVVLTGMGPLPTAGGVIEGHFDAQVHHDGTLVEYFGRALAAVGDVTGDGAPDVAVGIESWGYPTEAGAVLILGPYAPGRASAWETAAAQVLGDGEGRLGWCVEGADVNADGVHDLLVGAPHRSGNGELLIYLGPVAADRTAAEADIRILGRTPNAQLGKGCANLSDGNLDGYDDVGVSASGDSYGWAGVFAEGFTGSSVRAETATGQVIGTSTGSGGYFGASIHPAGDLDQDGVPDLLVGEVQWDPLAARAWFGPLVGVARDTEADITAWTPDGVAGYLRQMHGGEDLTGDTVPDLLVSDELRGAGEVWLVPGVGF